VSRRVIGVAILAPELNRDAPVAGRGEDEEKLFEVWAVVFRVTVGDGRCTFAPQLPALGTPVLPTESHGCGVVVELIESKVKLSDNSHDDIGEQCSPVGIEEAVEGSSNSVVGDRHSLRGGEAETFWSEGADDLILSVDRLALHEEGPEKDTQSFAIGDTDTTVRSWYEAIEPGIQIKAPDEVVDEGERSEPLHFEGGVLERWVTGVGLTPFHLAFILSQDMENVNHAPSSEAQ